MSYELCREVEIETNIEERKYHQGDEEKKRNSEYAYEQSVIYSHSNLWTHS